MKVLGRKSVPSIDDLDSSATRELVVVGLPSRGKGGWGYVRIHMLKDLGHS